MRTMIMYGADIGEAELFHEIRERLLPYRVELRDVRTRTLLLSISSRSELSFRYEGETSLHRVEEVVTFLTKAAYVQWPDVSQ